LSHKAAAPTLHRPMTPLYEKVARTFAHSPRSMLKSVLFELEHEAPELFEGVRSTVFRRWDKPTIVSDFVLRWALAHDMARVKVYEHSYISTGAREHSVELEQLALDFGTLDFFCINDTTDDAHAEDPRLKKVQTMLQSMLPLPSQFERLAKSTLPLPELQLSC
jgi:hypothetical protein